MEDRQSKVGIGATLVACQGRLVGRHRLFQVAPLLGRSRESDLHVGFLSRGDFFLGASRRAPLEPPTGRGAADLDRETVGAELPRC